MGPDLTQHPLTRADGSTVLRDCLCTVIAGVNGPVEVQRRDELPEEAAIEVNVRPSSGVGGPRERWLELVVRSVLRSVLLVNIHPRTLIQVTLQLTREPETKFGKTATDISILPTLVNAAFAAMVDGALPLATTINAVLAVVKEDGKLVIEPQERDIVKSRSIHAVAYSADGEQLLDQSSGSLSLEVLEKVANATQQACIAAMVPVGEDTQMADGDALPEPWLHQALQDHAKAAGIWREET